jgi:hypothetical protein
MVGVPQPLLLFQGMVNMWSVNVLPKTSLEGGSFVLGEAVFSIVNIDGYTFHKY